MLISEFASVTRHPRVYLDLDGVVANFFAGYQELNPAVRSEREMPDGPDSTYDLMRDTDFFYRLPVYSSAQELVATILEFVPGYTVLTAPLHGDYANSKRWKTRWVVENLHPAPRRVIVTAHKWRHAVDPHTGVANVLIDDKQKNLRPWRQSGGHAIEYFAPRTPVSEVQARLQEIFRHES